MANSNNLHDLRMQVRKAQKNANNKASRLRSNGVEIGGTKFDPRRPFPKIRIYNTIQLKAYLKSLESFNSRQTRFVGDADSRPIPRSEWNRYKKAELTANKRIRSRFEEVSNIKLRGGLTIKERRAMMTPTHPTASRVVTPYFDPRELNSMNVASRSALKTLTKQQLDKATDQFDKRQLMKSRKELNQMLDGMGMQRYKTVINKMSLKEFQILWNYTGFASAASFYYTVFQEGYRGSDKTITAAINDFNEAVQDIEWVKALEVGGGLRNNGR